MYGGLSATLSWFGGALVLASNGGFESASAWAWVGWCTLQIGQTMLPYCEPQLKTQPQHTTTNMSCCRPTPQRLCPLPLSTWQHPPWPQILAPPLSMGLSHWGLVWAKQEVNMTGRGAILPPILPLQILPKRGVSLLSFLGYFRQDLK